MAEYIFRIVKPPRTHKTVDQSFKNRLLTERLSMPWMSISQADAICAEKILILVDHNEQGRAATLESQVTLPSASPFVLYSTKGGDMLESKDGKLGLYTADPLVPLCFLTLSEGVPDWVITVEHVVLMFDALGKTLHDDRKAGLTMIKDRFNQEMLKMTESGIWSETHSTFVVPFAMLKEMPTWSEHGYTNLPLGIMQDWLDFTSFCSSYEDVALFFSLCRYMNTSKVRLYWKNRRLSKDIYAKIKTTPKIAFLLQLIEVEGLRQVVCDFPSDENEPINHLQDKELADAVQLHEALLEDCLITGSDKVALSHDSALSVLVWLGGVTVARDQVKYGRLAVGHKARAQSVQFLDQIASFCVPARLMSSSTITEQFTITNLLIVNNRSTIGRNGPTSKELEFYRTYSLVVITPDDINQLETRFDELVVALRKLQSGKKIEHPILPVVMLVDVHLFSPIMLRTALCFLLESKHGFQYNDLKTEMRFTTTATGLPYKFLITASVRHVFFATVCRTVLKLTIAMPDSINLVCRWSMKRFLFKK